MRSSWGESLRHDGRFWRRLAFVGSSRFPKWWVRSTPPLFAAIFFALVGRNRRASVANWKRMRPGEGAFAAHRGALRTFIQFAWCMTEGMEQLGERPRPIRFDVPENPFFDLVSEGRGLVVVTAHLGNWDVAARRLHELGHPIRLVMANEPNASARSMVQAMREHAGMEITWSDSNVLSGIEMVRALRAGKIVALQLDRPLPGSTVRAHPFFGSPAAFPVGPFALARATGAPILPLFVPRKGPCEYELRIGTPVRVVDGPRDTAIGDAMARTVAQFEAIVRELPTQWFQFAPFWPEDEVTGGPAS